MHPHNAKYYDERASVEEKFFHVELAGVQPINSEKISINHYRYKSREEYEKKSAKTDVFYLKGYHNAENYDVNNPTLNAVFDDGILKYREERKDSLAVGGGIN